MKTLAPLACIALQCLGLQAFAAGEDRCLQQYELEASRITREYTGSPPASDSMEAKTRWAKGLHDALAQAAEKAEACTRASRAAAAPARLRAEQDCAAQSHRAGDELTRRYAGRNLTPAEQTARRAEEMKLLDERAACIQAARR